MDKRPDEVVTEVPDDLAMTFPVSGSAIWPAEPTPGPGSRLPVQPTNTRANIASIALSLYAALALVSSIFLARLAGLGFGVEGGTADLADYQALSATVVGLGVLEIVVAIFALVALLMWLHRFVRNAPLLGSGELFFTPRWAVVYWFIPIGSWYLPYRVLKTLLQRLGGEPVRSSTRLTFLAWWVTWLVASVSGSVFFILRQSDVSAPMLQAMTSLSGVGSFALAILSIAVLRTLQRSADRRSAAVAADDLDDATPMDAAPIDARRSGVAAAAVAILGSALVLAVLAVNITGQPGSVAWRMYTSSDRGFSALFPREPFDKTSTLATDVGPATQHVFGAYLRLSESYAVTYIDYPAGSVSNADPDAILDAMASSIDPAGVVSNVTMGTHPGREVIATTATGTDIHMRLYLDGDRVYAIEVDNAKGTVPSEDMQRFFGSFRIN